MTIIIRKDTEGHISQERGNTFAEYNFIYSGHL